LAHRLRRRRPLRSQAPGRDRARAPSRAAGQAGPLDGRRSGPRRDDRRHGRASRLAGPRDRLAQDGQHARAGDGSRRAGAFDRSAAPVHPEIDRVGRRGGGARARLGTRCRECRGGGARPRQSRTPVNRGRSAPDADVIDALVGITPGSALDAIRARRPEARAHAEATYRALFTPGVPGGVTAHERFAVGTFVAGLHGATAIAAAYARRLADSGAPAALRAAVDAAVKEAATHGPYGSYPAWPLSREDTAGPIYRVGAARGALGARLAAAFEHTHML